MKFRIVAVVTALSLGLAIGPASARTEKPPPMPPAGVAVAFVGSTDGMAGNLLMRIESSRSGAVEYFADGTAGSSPANLELRGFAAFLDQGLHGGLVSLDPNECGEPPLYEGLFWLSFDRKGELTAAMWQFDIDASYLAARKHGCTWRVNERYSIRSLDSNELLPGEIPLSVVDGVVSGTFTLHLYDADAAEPHTELARGVLTFGLDING